MLRDSYELNIISRHPKFTGSKLTKHFIDSIDTIGVWGEEPFEIQVKNNTSRPVQARISLDGTDVLTGEKATVKPHGKMWLLEAGETMNLPAWPESNENGARFVFGKTANSVAANTHGDVSNKGVIAVAFFTESYAPPTMKRLEDRRSILRSKVETKGCGSSYGRLELCASGARADSNSIIREMFEGPAVREMSEGPAVGAGETIRQKIASVQGFREPALDRVISLRYLWWDELKIKLEASETVVHPSGFVDFKAPQKLINLGNTPRMDRVNSL